MRGDDYLAERAPERTIDTGSPWVSALLIAVAIALILTCLPGVGS